LVKQRSTGKLGVAIVHGTTSKVTILGAGSVIGKVAMTSSGWIHGMSFPKRVPPMLKVKPAFHISAATHFW
jgi:hypothetical protein